MGLREIEQAARKALEERARFEKDGSYQVPTFAALMQQDEIADWLPEALDTLCDSLYMAFSPMALEAGQDPRKLFSQSLDEFENAALEKLGEPPEDTKKELTSALDELGELGEALKAGRVLSKKNEGALRSALDALQAVLAQMGADEQTEKGGKPSKGTPKDKRLRENTMGVYTTKAKTTDEPWDGAASRFDDDQWKRSCVVDTGEGDTAKERYKVPIREPDGTLNVNALGPAAAALNGARGGIKASADAIAAGKKKLAAAYKEAGKTPPDSIAKEIAYAIIEKSDELRRTVGPLYSPNRKDAHGEYAEAQDLEDAIAEYVKAGDMRIRLQHNTEKVAGHTIGIIAWPKEERVMLKTADGGEHEAVFPAGTIYQSVEWTPDAWKLVKAGKLGGLSLGGIAVRLEGVEDLPEMGEE